MTRPSRWSLRPGFEQVRLIRPPAHSGSSVFVVEISGEVAARDAGGHERWRRPVVRPRPPMTAQVAIAARGGMLLVDDSDELSGLAPADGTTRWISTFPGHIDLAHFDGALLWGYRGDTRSIRDPGQIFALAVDDGSLRPMGPRPRHALVVSTTSDLIVVMEEMKNVIAVDRRTGDERWRHTLERPSTSDPGRIGRPSYPAIHAGGLLVIRVSDVGFVAIDRDDGRIAWEVDLQVGGGPSAIVVGDRLHVADAWRFIELDVTTGKSISDVAITDPEVRRKTGTSNAIVHHDGVLYGATLEGTVFGWSLAERALVWSHAVGARVEWSCPPQVFLDALWIMDAQGALHVFELG